MTNNNQTNVNALKIVSISELLEKNGVSYRKIGLKPVAQMGGMTIYSAKRPYTRVVFGANKDKNGGIIPADAVFTQIQEGSLKEGDGLFGNEHTWNTTPFIIKNGERATEVSTFSCCVFSHENAIKVANRQLKGNKACVLLGDEVTCPENLSQEVVSN